MLYKSIQIDTNQFWLGVIPWPNTYKAYNLDDNDE